MDNYPMVVYMWLDIREWIQSNSVLNVFCMYDNGLSMAFLSHDSNVSRIDKTGLLI